MIQKLVSITRQLWQVTKVRIKIQISFLTPIASELDIQVMELGFLKMNPKTVHYIFGQDYFFCI